MNLKTEISEKTKEAMKARDQERLLTLRFLQSAIKNKEIEVRPKEISNDDVMSVLKKMVKQRKESIDQYRSAGRADLADKEENELKILNEFLPPELTREQIEALVAEVISSTGASSMKDMGKVMKEATAKSGGAADSKLLSEIVKSKLN